MTAKRFKISATPHPAEGRRPLIRQMALFEKERQLAGGNRKGSPANDREAVHDIGNAASCRRAAPVLAYQPPAIEYVCCGHAWKRFYFDLSSI